MQACWDYWHGSLPWPRRNSRAHRSFGLAPSLYSCVNCRLCVSSAYFLLFFLCTTWSSTILSVGEMTAYAPISGSLLLYGKLDLGGSNAARWANTFSCKVAGPCHRFCGERSIMHLMISLIFTWLQLGWVRVEYRSVFLLLTFVCRAELFLRESNNHFIVSALSDSPSSMLELPYRSRLLHSLQWSHFGITTWATLFANQCTGREPHGWISQTTLQSTLR